MKIHNNKELFKTIILQAELSSGLSSDILEKDYYVTLVLKELSNKQDEIKAYFKGGTALYKALRNIKRFSEDIDLTVCVDGLTNNQARKRLEASALDYSLVLKKNDIAFSIRKGSITAVYGYESVIHERIIDELQKSGKVVLEATSFTVSEPVAEYTIEPLIFSLASKNNQITMMNDFEVSPFLIRTITLERIFIDKIFAIEFYSLRKNWFDVGKHLYDISVLLEIETIKSLFCNKEKLDYLIAIKRKEERNRKGGIPDDLEIRQFSYFEDIQYNQDLKKSYQLMQNKYVLNKENQISFDTIVSVLERIRMYFK